MWTPLHVPIAFLFINEILQSLRKNLGFQSNLNAGHEAFCVTVQQMSSSAPHSNNTFLHLSSSLLDFYAFDCFDKYLFTRQFCFAGNKEPEYYVKYTGRAHIHDEWVSESTLMSIAKRKCINFKRKHPEPCYEIEDEWMIPERFVARRCAPSGPGWEVLVKWQNQSFEHCTWEVHPHVISPFTPFS